MGCIRWFVGMPVPRYCGEARAFFIPFDQTPGSRNSTLKNSATWVLFQIHALIALILIAP